MSSVTVTAPSRLHFGLIDLAGTTHRRYGGVGVMLKSPTTVIQVSPSPSVKVVGLGLESRTIDDVLSMIERLAAVHGEIRARLDISSHIPEHVGLGSKTALLLGCLVGLRALLRLPVTDQQLKALSGRGGTSGIGINGFFTGGCIVDCGQPQTRDAFVPTSAIIPAGISLMSNRLAAPPSWQFCVLLAPGVMRTSDEERGFFRHNTPLAPDEALEVLGLVHHGIVPAILTDDISLLSRCLDRVHATGFKQRELQGQSLGVQHAYDQLKRADLGAVGMSSLGPSIYLVTDRDRGEIDAIVSDVAAGIPASSHWWTTVAENGHALTRE